MNLIALAASVDSARLAQEAPDIVRIGADALDGGAARPTQEAGAPAVRPGGGVV